MAPYRPRFPVIAPDTLTALVFGSSAGRARRNVDVVFEMIGGAERLADWADKNPGEFFTKLYAKNIERQGSTQVSVAMTLEDRLRSIDGRVIDAEIIERTEHGAIEPGPVAATDPFAASRGATMENDDGSD